MYVILIILLFTKKKVAEIISWCLGKRTFQSHILIIRYFFLYCFVILVGYVCL